MRRSVTISSLFMFAMLLPVWAQQDVISTAIGGGPNGIPAIQANVNAPTGVALDPSGNLYIAASAANRVYKVSPNGTLTVVAGTGAAGYAGDGIAGGAANALLNDPIDVAADSAGNVYITDYKNYVVRKVDTTNTITTIAGVAGLCGYNGDGSPATSFHLCYPYGLALDNSGDLYIADYDNCRVRKLVLATETISTFAGTGTCSYTGDGGLATSAEVHYPFGVAADGTGDVFIADSFNFRIREVASSTGIINTVGGNGKQGFSGDGNSALGAEIGYVYTGISVNSAGTVVTFADYTNNRIRQFTVGGNITTVAGTGSASFCGEGGLPTSACLHSPQGLALAASGAFYIGDTSNNRVREFTVGGTINTVAGNGSTTYPTLVSGFPPQGVVFSDPIDVLNDPSGNVFISEPGNCMVRERVKATGLVNIFAGSAASGATIGSCGFSGGGGAATSAQLGTVSGIARDSLGNIYIADTSNCVVWQVSASTLNISIFAGVTPKKCGFTGDGGLATSAELDAPTGLFVDSKNNLYIADSTNNRVREVTSGTINTIAGNGTAGYLGDGDPATAAELHDPTGVSVDRAGDVFIADYDNCVIREITAATGLIGTVAGNGTCGNNGDGIATEHEINHPDRVVVDANGNLFISDDVGQRVRWVSLAGMMTTIAGTGTAGLIGDGGPATSAEFDDVGGITQDASGNFLIADYLNLRVREVTAFAALNTSASSLNFGLVTVGTSGTPQTLTLSALGPVTISNISITGPFTEYDDCGSGLSNGQTCIMYVIFKPTATGAQSGSITIEDNSFFNDIPTTISLEGTGSAVAVTGGTLQFGNQTVNTSSVAKMATVTNKGTKAVTMGAITVNDTTDFVISAKTCPAAGSTLAASAGCTVSVNFKPKTTGLKKAALIITDSDPSSPQIVGLSGTGTSLVALSPNSITFPAQAVGTTTPTANAKSVTLTNTTATSLTLGTPAVSVTGPFSAISATSCTNGLVIAPSGSCVIYVVFSPTTVGYPTGTLSVTDSDATSPQTVALAGTATGIEFSVPSVNFGTSTVGHQVSSSVTITNAGTSSITFTAATITGPNSADFSTNNGDPPCHGLLAPGAACTFTAYFTPSIMGIENATYMVYDNNTGSPQMLPLTGTGN